MLRLCIRKNTINEFERTNKTVAQNDLFGILAIALIVLIIRFSVGNISRGPTKHDVANPDERRSNSASLLESAKREKLNPGIIERYACQIPKSAKEYSQAILQQHRAETILQTVLGPILRKNFAERLQHTYFENAYKVHCSVVEGRRPQLRMQMALFDETTAWWMSAKMNKEAEIPKLGFFSIAYSGSPGEGSTTTWTDRQVDALEFGEIRNRCEKVRSGELNPNTINATGRDPA